MKWLKKPEPAKPVRAPSISLSDLPQAVCHEMVAEMAVIPPDEMCMWIVIAVHHRGDPAASCATTPHQPQMVVSDADHIETLAWVAEQSGPRLRAAVHLDIPDAPPIM